MTANDLDLFARDLAADTREFVLGHVARLEQRLSALETRAVESDGVEPRADTTGRKKLRVRHRGEWSETAEYSLDDAVVFGSRLYRCSVGYATRAVPGADGGICWTRADAGVAS
jgi:hypothetical protein